MVPVKLFNRKCSGIIFEEKIFDLNNLLKLILLGVTRRELGNVLVKGLGF